MLFFFIRHGDPVYDPDSLTPLGQRQAEAVAKRFALYGLDRIYASTSTRAILTATPTSELLKKEIVTLDFAHETHAWRELSVELPDGNRTWCFFEPGIRRLFTKPDMIAYGQKWYEHPLLKEYGFSKGFERIRENADRFLKELGFEHIPGEACYRVTGEDPGRVALFAHQGFGLAFLSCILDVPYPLFSTHFDMGHTGVTVIDFRVRDGIATPCVLSLANDSHLYREGIMTGFQNRIRF